jgi:hypothetical protein
MTTETQINAATLRNLTDEEFIRLYVNEDNPLLQDALRRMDQLLCHIAARTALAEELLNTLSEVHRVATDLVEEE